MVKGFHEVSLSWDLDSLEQDCSNSIADAQELVLH